MLFEKGIILEKNKPVTVMILLGYSVFFSTTFAGFLLIKGKKKNRKQKTKSQQCGFERVRPTNARISKSN